MGKQSLSILIIAFMLAAPNSWAVTEYYVDVSVASNGGDGSSGTPWTRADGQVTQFALNTITQGASGDRINHKAGAAETLSSALTLATYGTPTATNPLIIQGYTSTQGDLGIGEIDCNGASCFTVATYDSIHIVHMKMHNAGANKLIAGDDFWAIVESEIYNSTGSHCLDFDDHSQIIGNYIHDCEDEGSNQDAFSINWGNYYRDAVDTSQTFNEAIRLNSNESGFMVGFNTIHLNNTASGAKCINTNNAANDSWIINNTCYNEAAGTGVGIELNQSGSSAGDTMAVMNNYIEGFSGSGGRAFEQDSTGWVVVMANNYEFDNETGFSIDTTEVTVNTNNVTLTASGLNDPANGDYSPNDLLKNNIYPLVYKGINPEQEFYNYVGAIQRNIDDGKTIVTDSTLYDTTVY